MKGYGQFCPVAKAAGLFCEKWTPLIVRDLAWGATRFSELQRGVPLMSPTLLSRRLKQLETEGIVERRSSGNARTSTYHLTPAGRDFIPVIEALGVWGQRWSRRQLAEGEIDLGLLIWALERSVDATAFGAGRTVVQLELTDQPAGKHFWWFLNYERGGGIMPGGPRLRQRPLFGVHFTRHDIFGAWRPNTGSCAIVWTPRSSWRNEQIAQTQTMAQFEPACIRKIAS